VTKIIEKKAKLTSKQFVSLKPQEPLGNTE